MKSIYFFIYLFSTVLVQAQSKSSTVEISFSFLTKRVTDSSGLNLKIIYENKSTVIDSIYKYFEEGDLNSEDYNIKIDMEKFKDGKYCYYPLTYYHTSIRNYERPVDKCDDLPKKIIPPNSFDTIVYNLLNSKSSFEEGKYRFKASVRTSCTINGRGSSENPISPDMIFKKSEWIYFEVLKPVLKRLY